METAVAGTEVDIMKFLQEVSQKEKAREETGLAFALRYAEGYTMQEIGQEHDVARQWVSDRIAHAMDEYGIPVDQVDRLKSLSRKKQDIRKGKARLKEKGFTESEFIQAYRDGNLNSLTKEFSLSRRAIKRLVKSLDVELRSKGQRSGDALIKADKLYRLYNFVKSFIRESNQGPSHKEIRDEIGLNPRTTKYYLDELDQAGLILVVPKQARGISLPSETDQTIREYLKAKYDYEAE